MSGFAAAAANAEVQRRGERAARPLEDLHRTFFLLRARKVHERRRDGLWFYRAAAGLSV